MEPPIYLDHNATTPLLAEVSEAMRGADTELFGNPASQHAAGRLARRRLETARESIAHLLGAQRSGPKPDQLIFTSGGTESNNHALMGRLAPFHAAGGQPSSSTEPGRVLVSRIEHPSVLEPLAALARWGWEIDWLDPDSQGGIDPAQAEALLRPETRLAVLMLGNNETGVLQPVREVAGLCAARGVPLHCDAVQAVGKIGVDFRRLGAASLTFTAHKFHGPTGIGGLLVRGDYALAPWLLGGFQPGGRSGTPSVPLAVGMQKALKLAEAEGAERGQRLARLRDRLEKGILAAVPSAMALGAGRERLPHTSAIAFRGFDRQALQMALDAAGLACSTGSACASGSAEPSHVLVAMGMPEEVVRGGLRFSLGVATTEAEIDSAIGRISRCCRNLGHA